MLGSKITFMQMKRIGLNMHVGIGDKQSKTEAMFIPTKANIQKWIKEYNKTSLYSTTMPIINPYARKKEKSSVKKMETIINRCYDTSMCTKEIIDDFGFITFTKEFKYLGSVISYDLDEYSDISLRIKKLIKLWEL